MAFGNRYRPVAPSMEERVAAVKVSGMRRKEIDVEFAEREVEWFLGELDVLEAEEADCASCLELKARGPRTGDAPRHDLMPQAAPCEKHKGMRDGIYSGSYLQSIAKVRHELRQGG